MSDSQNGGIINYNFLHVFLQHDVNSAPCHHIPFTLPLPKMDEYEMYTMLPHVIVFFTIFVLPQEGIQRRAGNPDWQIVSMWPKMQALVNAMPTNMCCINQSSVHCLFINQADANMLAMSRALPRAPLCFPSLLIPHFFSLASIEMYSPASLDLLLQVPQKSSMAMLTSTHQSPIHALQSKNSATVLLCGQGCPRVIFKSGKKAIFMLL